MENKVEKVTADDVAAWMLGQLEAKKWLYQEVVVYKIKKEFGEDFVYLNASGNLAIGKDVLKSFKKITENSVVWERGEKAWRKLRENEKYTGRQVD
ncbi:hypothetical protein EDC56_1150 [Sinobacterium caligoides]|uniref:Uncharacterized protein n=1 Tax=Sinobacterium caligoides TaxID=933926 RepID=A0A3N2E0I1_9GAMM|nr:hypothetical protein [Sinobacterium caligoides]ROS05604.1 hypothetical protein EDC56_1150 [Sinobacterium caligoides]